MQMYKVPYQNFEHIVWRLALHLNPVDLDDLVAHGDQPAAVGRAAVHHAGDQDAPSLLFGFDGGALELIGVYLSGKFKITTS